MPEARAGESTNTLGCVDTSLVPLYGEEFLRYVLALDPQPDLDDVSLTQAQQEALDALGNLVSSAPTSTDDLGRHTQLTSLLAWRGDTGASIPNALRLHAGGALPSLPSSDDPLVNRLLLIARDVWPTFLVPPPSTGPSAFWVSIPLGVFDHDSTIPAAQAFLGDPNLRLLYPGAPSNSRLDRLSTEELLQIQSFWMSTSGRGGTSQLITLLASLISNARLWALATRGDGTWLGLCTALPELLACLRTLARGEVARVPRCIAFVGLTVPDEITVDLAMGQLRAPRPSDSPYLIPREVSATAILTTTYPMQICDVRAWKPSESQELFSEGWDQLHRTQEKAAREIDLVRLATVLASTTDRPWSLTQVASMAIDPTAPGGAMFWEQGQAAVRQAELDRAGADRILDWAATVAAQHPAELDIAMRRILGAAGSRSDPVDGLVDAVIAWENCFGTQSETTFRVTAAIACLLEEGSEARLRRQGALKKIYEKRSRIVHGALHLDGENASRIRDQALDVALDCMRHLYTIRTDLLTMAPAERSTVLLLEGGRQEGLEVESDMT